MPVTDMPDYRRVYVPGGRYFFTLVTKDRRPLLAGDERVELLRAAFRKIRAERPFEIEAAGVLPEHLHCVCRPPDGDAEYSGRWREIKKAFSRALGAPSDARRERGVWQRGFWEHPIRDDEDWRRHVDYVHFNPVKHGHVARAAEWAYSSFRRAVERGWYPADWGAVEPDGIVGFSP